MILELSQKNKDRVRFSLYLISASLILFFISQIFATSAQLDEHLFESKNELTLDLNFENENINEYQEIDLNQELGGVILKIALYLIQIMFLLNFMVILFIYEINGKNKND